jgi:hypothetical protein
MNMRSLFCIVSYLPTSVLLGLALVMCTVSGWGLMRNMVQPSGLRLRLPVDRTLHHIRCEELVGRGSGDCTSARYVPEPEVANLGYRPGLIPGLIPVARLLYWRNRLGFVKELELIAAL